FQFQGRRNRDGLDRTALLQAQRDCDLQPRVARNELPWVDVRGSLNPNGVGSSSQPQATTPLGLLGFGDVPQGSSFRATLGFEPESLRDSTPEFARGIEARRFDK